MFARSTGFRRPCARTHLMVMLAAILCLSHAVKAADVPAAAADTATAAMMRPVDLRVLKQELPQVLQALAEQSGVRVTLSKGLASTVTNLHLQGSMRDALDSLAERINAVWWWTGSDVKMVDRSDIVTKTVKTREIDATMNTARSLGMPVDLVTAQRAEVSGIVRITGPSGLVAEIETLAQDVADQVSRVHVTKFGKRRLANVK